MSRGVVASLVNGLGNLQPPTRNRVYRRRDLRIASDVRDLRVTGLIPVERRDHAEVSRRIQQGSAIDTTSCCLPVGLEKAVQAVRHEHPFFAAQTQDSGSQIEQRRVVGTVLPVDDDNAVGGADQVVGEEIAMRGNAAYGVGDNMGDPSVRPQDPRSKFPVVQIERALQGARRQSDPRLQSAGDITGVQPAQRSAQVLQREVRVLVTAHPADELSQQGGPSLNVDDVTAIGARSQGWHGHSGVMEPPPVCCVQQALCPVSPLEGGQDPVASVRFQQHACVLAAAPERMMTARGDSKASRDFKDLFVA